jgi:hypothetical protein
MTTTRAKMVSNNTKYSAWQWWLAIALFLLQASTVHKDTTKNPEELLADISPWALVGGCGAGGSGSGGGDGITWLGQGVDGGTIQVEVLPKYSVGQNFHFFTIAPRWQWKPSWSSTLGISTPFLSKTAEVQAQSDQPAVNRTVGGIGDLALDYGFTMGPSGELGVTFGLSAPTAQYDIKRGPDASAEFLPASLQKGSGLWNASLALSWIRDVEDGFWSYNLSYSRPFVTRWLSGQNEFLDSYWQDYAGMSDARFYYDWKFYGENDLGDYTPPSLSGGVYYAYRGTPGMVYSWGLSWSVPLGTAWIHSPKVGLYDPFPDPDHKMWSAALVYGMEFSRSEYPIYMAASFPIHDKTNVPGLDDDKYDPAVVSKWDGPDWGDFMQQWTLAVGFKSAFW